MWPSFASRFGRRLNQRLLCRQLLPMLQKLPEPPIVVTTIPLVADLIGKLPVRRWIYYCVDDFAVWPGLDGTTLRHMEIDLVRGVDRLVAASAVLQKKLAAQGREALLLTHGVDVGFWSQRQAATLDVVAKLPRPFVVFWGLIDRRLDLAWLRALTSALPEVTLVFAGPEDDPDPELAKVPRLVRTGPLPFDHLPTLAAAAAVLVMPYADLPVTQAMEPLKLKEYLATGRPVVVRDLPANRAWADALDIVDSPETFVSAVLSRLSGEIPEQQRQARLQLAEESWPAKAALFSAYALGGSETSA
jgi:glycosyltransferase involved in cell wall biosynthesis